MRADVTGYTLWANGRGAARQRPLLQRHAGPSVHRADPRSQRCHHRPREHEPRLLDGRQQQPPLHVGQPHSVRARPNHGISVTEVDGQRAYANKASRYQRVMVLNTVDPDRPYLVDVFRVTGGATHDYTLHGAIRFDSTWESEPAARADARGVSAARRRRDVGPSRPAAARAFPYYGFWRSRAGHRRGQRFKSPTVTRPPARRDVRLWVTDGGGRRSTSASRRIPERMNTDAAELLQVLASLADPPPPHRRPARSRASSRASSSRSATAPARSNRSTRVPVAGGGRGGRTARARSRRPHRHVFVNLRNPEIAGAAGGADHVATADGQYRADRTHRRS